jgi:hypothetical protein
MKDSTQNLMKLENTQNLNLDLKAKTIKLIINILNQYTNKDKGKEEDLTNKDYLNR